MKSKPESHRFLQFIMMLKKEKFLNGVHHTYGIILQTVIDNLYEIWQGHSDGSLFFNK